MKCHFMSNILDCHHSYSAHYNSSCCRNNNENIMWNNDGSIIRNKENVIKGIKSINER